MRTPSFPPAPTRTRRRGAVATLAAVAAASLLPGCAGGPQGGGIGNLLSGLGVERAPEGRPSGFSFTPSAASAPAAVTARSMVGAEFAGLFKKHPITNSNRPETWPRVAITVHSVAPNAFQTVALGSVSTINADDCAVYTVTVWTSASASKSHEGLRLCYGEIYRLLQNVPLYQLETWGRRSFWPGERNTGSVRGTGPYPPADHFPNDPQLQNAWLDRYRNTMAFLAGPMQVLGFNWNDVNDKRVWIVSAPAGR